MRPKVLWLCLLACMVSVGEGRDPPRASTTAVQQPPPAQQGPSQPIPPQAQPAPPPGAGQQAAQVAQQAAAVERNPDWAVTLERIASSVVSIDIDATRAFDTEWNATAQATG